MLLHCCGKQDLSERTNTADPCSNDRLSKKDQDKQVLCSFSKGHFSGRTCAFCLMCTETRPAAPPEPSPHDSHRFILPRSAWKHLIRLCTRGCAVHKAHPQSDGTHTPRARQHSRHSSVPRDDSTCCCSQPRVLADKGSASSELRTARELRC